MKKPIILLLTLFALLPHVKPACAQSLIPFRSEYRKQAKGQLTLINDKDVPLRVTLRPQSFTSDENGHLKLLPLDNNVNLVLAQTSLRIPPKQTRYVSYEAKPKRAPAWFLIYATFTPQAEGIVIGTAVPHFAYITAGEPKQDEVALTAKYIAAKQLLRISFTSRSQQIARVESMETSGRPRKALSFISGDHQAETSGGFRKDLGSLTVLPGKSTVVEVKLPATNYPDSVKANLKKFKLQCPVTVE
jgi:hypothetical protein